MVHKPKHKVHSFRALLGDGGQDEIHLERSNVNLAYRIIKFELVANKPVTSANECVVQVWRESQSSISSEIDFSVPDLLAAGVYSNQTDTTYYPDDLSIIFDNVLFSLNIFVTHKNESGSESCNYYIELEEVPVGAATLMQIKLGTARRLISGSMGE
jgi:hypothetical protein